MGIYINYKINLTLTDVSSTNFHEPMKAWDLTMLASFVI